MRSAVKFCVDWWSRDFERTILDPFCEKTFGMCQHLNEQISKIHCKQSPFRRSLRYAYGFSVVLQQRFLLAYILENAFQAYLQVDIFGINHHILAGRRMGASDRLALASICLTLILTALKISARASCNVFDPWVRWERGQVGI